MRKFKFRAWDKNNNRMITDCSNFTHYHFGVNYQKDIIFMQFTGLFDKNGKEIYEGDIVSNGIVNLEVHYEWSQFSAGREPGILLSTIAEEVEIIGNIYENPNLLKNES